MSSRSPKAPGAPLTPDAVRGALRELGHAELEDDREFGAELHRRLAAAGEPPAFGWFAWLWTGIQSARPMLTGAVLGALVTATAFLLLARAGRPATLTRLSRPSTAAPRRRPRR